MIHHAEIGPRIFYTTDAAFEHRTEMGGRVFLPEPANGEIYWFPMAMTPTAILTHRLTAGLSGQLVTDNGKTTRHPKPPTGAAIRFEMTPEAWVNDHAIPIDPDGRDTHILVTEAELRRLLNFEGEITDAWLDDLNNGDLDVIRESDSAPRWMAEWDGPFTIDYLNREKI